MDEKTKDDLREVISLVRQLPENEISDLKQELKSKISVRGKRKKSKAALLKLILKGPVMSDAQYQEYLETRKWMNRWRMK